MKPLKFIILLLFVYSCNHNDSKTVSFPTKKEKITIHNNKSLFVILDKNNFNLIKLNPNRNKVIVYEKNGTTFVDEIDYEAFYKEILAFEFNPKLYSSFDTIKFQDSEIKKLKCYYSYRVSSKIPYKEVIQIDKGTIFAIKNKNTWQFKVDINTGFKFGGYFESKNEREINFEK